MRLWADWVSGVLALAEVSAVEVVWALEVESPVTL
jgi:hypothetical protein